MISQNSKSTLRNQKESTQSNSLFCEIKSRLPRIPILLMFSLFRFFRCFRKIVPPCLGLVADCCCNNKMKQKEFGSLKLKLQVLLRLIIITLLLDLAQNGLTTLGILICITRQSSDTFFIYLQTSCFDAATNRLFQTVFMFSFIRIVR